MKKKKNGLLQTFFYDFLKIQVTNWVREILVTCENRLSIIYWFLLRYTVIIYKFTQGNLGAKKIASCRFQSPVKKKNRKLRHWRPTARSLQCYTQASERACVTFSPSHFWQGKIIYANHLPWYIAVIIVFSKSRDKWLKKKLTWRNDRVYVKIVLYSSVTPLSEGKMVMNE
jgi:hypothetical protein